MKTILGKYSTKTVAKWVGAFNVLMAVGLFMRLKTLFYNYPPQSRPYLIAFFAPFSQQVTLGVEGTLICMSLIVGIALLKSKYQVALYPGYLLCFFQVAYSCCWGVVTFNQHNPILFIFSSLYFPIMITFLYGEIFLFFLRLSKAQENPEVI